MHVLQLGPYPPPEGGINRNILAIREELIKAGHRCSIVATSRSTKITPEPDVHHPASPTALLGLLRSIDSDVLHLHIGGEITNRVMALALACAVFGKGKKILSVHSGGYPTSEQGIAAKPNSFRGRVFRRFDQIIAVNDLISDVFARYGIEAERRHVIYPYVHRVPDNAVEVPNVLKDFATEHIPFLLTVGLLEPEYDLFMQIDAMEKVLAEFPNAGLMIVGSGSLENELRMAIDSKPYREKIFLAGDVEHRVTLHLLNKCDILLRTTLFDGDAISVREALFLGTPVIATDNRMRPEGVTLIPVNDPSAMVKAIQELGPKEGSEAEPQKDDLSNIAAVLNLYES
jgi:glycosyltransferase involved in cell wall biosynthesis